MTSPMRSGSSTSSVPYATTASLTVCQSQPSSSATSETARPARPTCSVTQRPARAVITNLVEPILGSRSVHDPVAQLGSGHCQRRLTHRSRVGRPNAGRSTSTTGSRSLTVARDPHDRHRSADASRVSISTVSGTVGLGSATPRTVTAGSPTSNSHMRVASVSTGVLSRAGSSTTTASQGPCAVQLNQPPRSYPKRRHTGRSLPLRDRDLVPAHGLRRACCTSRLSSAGCRSSHVPIGHPVLHPPRHRPTGPAPPRGRRRERGHEEAHTAVGGESHLEQRLAALGVTGERAVGEPSPVGLLDHVDDATGRADRQRPQRNPSRTSESGRAGSVCASTTSPASRCTCHDSSRSATASNRARP
jgi:hypothetical protein